MLVVLVYVHVKPEFVDPFKSASIENASASVNEAGIARFDVIQQNDDPTRFVLIEAYRSPDGLAKHREAKHYLKWRDAVEPMMAEPRTRYQYQNLFPDDSGWG